MAYLTSPQQGTGSQAPQNTSSALAVSVLQQGPLMPYTYLRAEPAPVGAGDALTLRPDGRLQYGGTVTGGRRVAIA